MAKKNFNFSDALTFGWRVFERYWADLVLVMLINLALSSAVFFGILLSTLGLLAGLSDKVTGLIWVGGIADVLFIILAIVIGIWMAAAYKEVAAAAIKHEHPRLAEFYHRAYKKLINYIGTYLLYGMAVGAGIILFIIPGIIFAIWYSLAPYLVATEKLGAVEAMKRSREIIQPYFWWILLISFLLSVVTGALSSLPYSAGLISLIVTPATTAVWAGVLIYLKKI